MARWQPGAARARLSAAAIELYAERGFEQTMVADIAERAGVASRTFFRHYADKREVLFGGWSLLHEAATAAVEAAPEHTSAMELVRLALDATAQLIGADAGRAHQRQAIISATPELQERELIKYDSLANDLAQALRQRGIGRVDADLAAHTGLAIYRIAFDRWATTDSPGTLGDVIADVLQRYQLLAGRNPGG